ncbi:MAG: hypothetical protein FJX60_13975 [Alphaproteobacteria bacterium]|nr:hypothetical protein [Alphaproteobacteria bacterium]
MPSPIGASGDAGVVGAPPIELSTKMQKVQTESKIDSVRLAERLASEAAAPPSDGRGRVVDTFA